jgi:CubicO group peptidase (beta-lactamase class C family)
LPNYVFAEQAAAGLYTTVDDLARFVAAGLGGPRGEPVGRGALRPETIAQMYEAAPNSNRPGGAYGLGYLIETLSSGERALSHTGGNRGWRSLFVALPESRKGLVVLTNSNSGDAVYNRIHCVWLHAVAAATRRGC